MSIKYTAGNTGDKVRSDCFIEFQKKQKGGIKLSLESKVDVMYGNSIKDLIFEMCRFYFIRNAEINIIDKGALPFTIAARFENLLKHAYPELDSEYLLPFNKKNDYHTKYDAFRRSRLYLPGNEPKFYPNAGLHKPDGIILDLEDSVAPSEKKAAQLLVRNALRSIDFYGAERMVRINQLPFGLEDLKFIVPHNVNLILIPKCEYSEDVILVEEEIDRIKKEKNIKSNIWLMPIIESSLGIQRAFEIAQASNNVCALAIGLEDYTADLGIQRTKTGTESIYARQALVNAAKAANVQAIDTVFSDVNDMDGLRDSVLEAKSLGFEGKGCIHPRQINIINKAFAPTQVEIEKAKKIVHAFNQAKAKGIGVISIGSKMIDAPVVKRAEHTISLAIQNDLLDVSWEKNFE